MKVFLPAALFLLAASAADAGGGGEPLDAPVVEFRVSHLPIEAAFLTLTRAYGLTFSLEPGMKGDVSVEVRGGAVRDVIDALVKSQGGYWQREGRLIAIRRNVVRFYEIEYPQMSRTASGSSSVVLSAQSAGNPGTGQPGPSAALASGALPNQTDQTNLSIQQQNQATFWADVQAELTGLAQTGEAVAVNRLAGLALVTASPDRQPIFRDLVEQLNRRISRQVRISARVLEVSLTRQNQLGVDWSLAASKIGGLSLTGWGASAGQLAFGGQPPAAPTFSGTLALGKVSALLQAVSEQGEVHSVSNPSVVSLSNQTAFVKVGTEQTFFSLSNSTTLNQAGASTPFSETQKSYTQNAITIGTVLYVTPKVNADESVTVDVLPAITQLIGVDTSPDGQQTAPRMDIKALSTLARLHPGEAVMIGGLIYEESDRQSRRVPLLGSLPVVGSLFGNSATAHSRSELVIFLTAEIVR